MLAIGTKAPDVTITTHKGYTGPISELWKDGPLILFFYPMDNTPTCTKQACTLRDNIAVFGKFNATVLGSSTGSVKSHQGFAGKYNIEFPLVADKGSGLAKAYKADRFLLPVSKRISYVIAQDGTIAGAIHSEASVKAHLDMIQTTLDRLGAT